MEFHSRHPNSHGFVGVSCEYTKIDSRCPQPLCTILYYNGTHYNGTLRCIACVGSYAEHCFVQWPVAYLAPSHFSKPCWILWPIVIKFTELVQTMACHLFDDKPLSESVPAHQWNQNRATTNFIKEGNQLSSANCRPFCLGLNVSMSLKHMVQIVIYSYKFIKRFGISFIGADLLFYFYFPFEIAL